MKRWLSVAAAVAILAGCSVRSDLTAVSGKNINLASIKLDKQRSKGHAKGEDCRHIIIFIPTSGPPTMSGAMDKALGSTGANLMLDAVAHYSWFYIPYIYGQECWRIEGTAYDTYQ